MHYRFIIIIFMHILAPQGTLHARDISESASRMIIYNNHTITQTVTTNPQECDRSLHQNRYPGHTKNEFTPSQLDSPVSPEGPSDPHTALLNNAHMVRQHTNMHYHDPLTPNNLLPTNNAYAPYDLPGSSWLTALIPPILSQSSILRYTLGGLGLCYGLLLAKLLYSSYSIVKKSDSWSCWKSQTALTTLQAHEKETAQELFKALQDFYINASTPAYFLSPLVHFINDVEIEMSQLTAFISLHSTIDKLKLTGMFPQQIDALNVAQEKIKRLEYLKNIIINWAGEYKA